MSKNSQKSHAVNMILNYRNFFERVSNLVESARHKTIRQINSVIIETYWRVGKLLVEEEQKGKKRANYGDVLITKLAQDLTKRFGRGFSKSNLFSMRKFYLIYPPRKFQALSGKCVSWSHTLNK